MGTTDGSNNRFYRQYTYNSFGDVVSLKEGTTTYGFEYDSLGRLTKAYDDLSTTADNPEIYTYWATNRFNSFNGKSYAYGSFPYHGVNTVGSVDRYDYDANGNMTVRDKGLGSQQNLTWDAENRLASVSGGVGKSYWYDADGQRIKTVSGGKLTYTQ